MRGLVRSTANGEKTIACGAAEYAIGDLRDRATLERALEGVNGVFYIAPVYPGDESQSIGTAFVEAAARASVGRFVFSSVIHPVIAAMDNHIQKVPVEAAVIASGMAFTILRPCHFYQNMAAAWPSVVASRVFAEPFSADSRLSHVDYRDVAEVGAIALMEDRLLGGTFDLCADTGLTRHDLASIMGDVLGQPISAQTADPDTWLSRLPIPDDGYTSGALARMYDYYDKHGLVGNPLALRTILGREPRSLRQFFQNLIDGTPTTAFSESPAPTQADRATPSLHLDASKDTI